MCHKGHCLPLAGHHLILPGTRGTSVHVYVGETGGRREEGRYHTGKGLHEELPASQAALLTAGGRLQSRSSSRPQCHTFASLSPSTLGTFQVSLCTASILFPSRKTTAPSSIPSCKRNRIKHPRDSAEGGKYLRADPVSAHENKTFSGSRIRPFSHSSNSLKDLWKEA